jgi:phage terminase large subunit
MGAREIIIPYSPREQFQSFHGRAQRWCVIVAHRRAGKTVACINELIKAVILCDKPDPRFAYIAPQFNQAKDIAWGYLQRYAGVIPGVEFNESELRADFPNGGRIRLYGADNPDRLRGLYLDGVVLDEPADMKPRLWPEVVRPALSDRKGWAVFIGTPKGKNDFWEIWNKADEEWFRLTLKASDTNLINDIELASARKTMSEDQYEQEYECSFEAAILGAIYGKEMKEAQASGRIRNVPYDPRLLVTTAWDLGKGNSTAIWFAQVSGAEVRVIDYYETSGAGLGHYAKIIKEKPYVYDEHILPHDVMVSDLSVEVGVTRLDILKGLGISNVRVLERVGLEDGINATRMFFPRCYFDETNCKRGLEALRQYQYEWIDDAKRFSKLPRHDWTSDPADGFRYLAIGAREFKKAKPIVYKSVGIV